MEKWKNGGCQEKVMALLLIKRQLFEHIRTKMCWQVIYYYIDDDEEDDSDGDGEEDDRDDGGEEDKY